MPRIKLKIEYDGTNYVGWQVQRNGVSIQGEIEDSLKKIFNQGFIPIIIGMMYSLVTFFTVCILVYLLGLNL